MGSIVRCDPTSYNPVVAYSRCDDKGTMYPNMCKACLSDGVDRYIELEECDPFCPGQTEEGEAGAAKTQEAKVQPVEGGELIELPPPQQQCSEGMYPVCGYNHDGESHQFDSP